MLKKTFSKRLFILLFFSFTIWTLINTMSAVLESNYVNYSNYLIRKAENDNTYSEQYLYQSLQAAYQSKHRDQIAFAYKCIGNFHWSKRKIEKSTFYYQKGLSYLSKTTISLTKSKLLLNLSLINENKSLYDSVFYYASIALSVNPEWAINQKINIYQTIGNAHYTTGKYTRALFYYLSVFSDIKPNQDQVNYHEIINNIALCYSRLKRNYKSLSFYKKALKLEYVHSDSILFAETYHGIGKILRSNNYQDSALKYQAKAYGIFVKANDIEGQINTLNEIGAIYAKTNCPLGSKYLLQALEKSIRIANPFYLANSYAACGIFYKEQNDYSRAIIYLQKAYRISDSLRLNDINTSVTYHLSKCFFALNRTNEAYHMYEIYTTYLNFSFEQRKSLSEAEEWFSSFNEQKLKLIQEQTDYQIRLIILIAFSISLVMIGFIYRRLNRKRVDDLQNYQTTLTTILENLQEGIIGIGPGGTVLYLNALLTDYLGCRQPKPTGQMNTIRQYLFSNTKLENDFLKNINVSLTQGEQYFEFQRTIDEHVRYFEATFRRFPVLNQNQESNHFGVVVIIRDITDSVNHQQIQSQYQMSMLKSTIDGQEKERKRIAQDLHDSLAQLISGIKMQVEMLEKETSSNATYTLRLIHSIKENCQRATLEIKAIAYNLIPHDLEEFGLIHCLDQLCSRISEINQISIDFETNFPVDHYFNETEKLSIYRIAQEGLSNAVKHAQADMIKLILLCNEDSEQMILTIADNGIGFPISNNRTGMGLNTMHSRTKLLNGELNFYHDSGFTIVEAVFPLTIGFNFMKPAE